jgi:hypothetical protein
VKAQEDVLMSLNTAAESIKHGGQSSIATLTHHHQMRNTLRRSREDLINLYSFNTIELKPVLNVGKQRLLSVGGRRKTNNSRTIFRDD